MFSTHRHLRDTNQQLHEEVQTPLELREALAAEFTSKLFQRLLHVWRQALRQARFVQPLQGRDFLLNLKSRQESILEV